MNCPHCKKLLTEKTIWTADGIVYCLSCGKEVKDTNESKSEDLMDKGTRTEVKGVEIYDEITGTRRQVYFGKDSKQGKK